MAAPKKPAPKKPVSPERKAQMAAASRRYRARKAAEKYGVAVPAAVAAQRPAAYRPRPKAQGRRGKQAAKREAVVTAAERASARAAEARAARASIIENLPQARNPGANIFVSRDLKRAPAKNANADTIRRNAAAQKLQAAGRGLKREFATGDFSDARNRLSPAENARFTQLLARISKVSGQTLAIYFHHEGGSGEFSQVVQGILYPPDGSSPNEALDRLEVVADAVERGETLYGPKVVGRLNI